MHRGFPKEALVVEDEQLTRMVAADAVTDGGSMALEAGNADEALEVLAKRPEIGVVFTDVKMPGGLDGIAMAYEVSTTHLDVKIIVTFGAKYVQEDDLWSDGTFLPNPYRTERLVGIVYGKLDG